MIDFNCIGNEFGTGSILSVEEKDDLWDDGTVGFQLTIPDGMTSTVLTLLQVSELIEYLESKDYDNLLNYTYTGNGSSSEFSISAFQDETYICIYNELNGKLVSGMLTPACINLLVSHLESLL
jgi:hypothetical protein